MKVKMEIIQQKEHKNLQMKQRKQQIKHNKMQILVKDLKRMQTLQKMLLKKPKMLPTELKTPLITVIRKEKLKLLKKLEMLLIERKN